MKNLLFVFNPVAGKAQIVDRLYSVIDFYTRKGYLVTVLPTGILDSFQQVLQQQQKTFDLMICAGGDGTLNSVISQCMKLESKIPISYLPTGSTNDFARTLGYSPDFMEALKQINAGNERQIDIGKFNEKYFVYVAAFGSFAEVSYSTSQWSKNVLGNFAYLLKGIQKVTDLKAYSLKMMCDDQMVEGEFCLGLIMNSLSIGGFKNPVREDVVLDDGLFEVLMVRMPKSFNELQRIIASLISQKMDDEMFVYLQTGHLEIQSEKMEWTLDGERSGLVENIEIWNCQKAIRIVGI